MDITHKKRKLAKPQPSAAQSSQKRRKTAPQIKSKRAVALDKLQWKTVDVPEMFDDAEGFYGLEEVEGVDIVREGDTVKFVTAAPPASTDASGDEFGGFDDAPEATAAAAVDGQDMTPSEQPEEQNQTPKPKQEKEKSKTQLKKEQKKKEVKDKKETEKAKAKVAEKDDPELESDVFAKLGDIEDEAEDTDLSAWVPLDLSPTIMSAIGRLKFASPTLIQKRTIPKILEGLDVIGKASTGSGKTLAFGIPIVEQWLARLEQQKKEEARKGPIALILAPTRELAHQITNHIKELCAGLTTGPYICSVTGGLSVLKQQRQLEKADIVIGTPGRLWEVMSGNSKLLNGFKQIQFLVVDEADRLLTEGHFKEAEEILKALDRTVTNEDDDSDSDEEAETGPKRQTLVFSATFNKDLQQKLAGKGKYNLMDEKEEMEYLLKKLNFRGEPKFIDVNPVSQMAEKLKEGLVECGAMEKDLYLYALLMLQPTRRALVFTNSISIHSEMAQKARLRSLERFKAPKTGTHEPILVATDVAARGLDISGIELVIHYHVPRAADAYVHRSGRTARASSSGLSIMLCAPEEVVPTRRLVAKVHAAAQVKSGKSTKSSKDMGFFVRTIDIDRKLVSRLRERVVLAKKIADATLAKERGSKDENWMKAAAEELGVDYDSEELEAAGKWGGRGSGRKKKEKEAKEMTKAELGALKAELKMMLSQRINTGVSEKYITGSGVDINELLKGVEGQFLGRVDGLDIDV
ncbi:ATP-dependent RNA helicase [Coniochaeta pulveracea]|uniref:ATP-dependent RNA helicase n=1 Tax=Coniochaeta pulveracea TaxID=177199 RepID=A0A420YMX9_9PEZI|nr:ATP-dependent RNA helicase [Coniochaeta pulveracea]